MARKRVNDFYFSDDISISNWVTLLNYFQRRKYQLTTEEVQMLADKSDQIRTILNKPRKEEHILKRAEREDQKIIKYSAGLGIAQENVKPNPHKYLNKRLANEARKAENLRKEQEAHEAILEENIKKSSPARPLIGVYNPLPMAAKVR